MTLFASDLVQNLIMQHVDHSAGDLIHLLQGLLRYDPSDRLSAREALRHPFFSRDHLRRWSMQCNVHRKRENRRLTTKISVFSGKGCRYCGGVFACVNNNQILWTNQAPKTHSYTNPNCGRRRSWLIPRCIVFVMQDQVDRFEYF